MNIEVGTLKGRLYNGHSTVGTTRAKLNEDVRDNFARGVTVKADVANAGTVYVGGPAVTAVTGYPLTAGESLYLPVMQTDQINVIGSVADQGYSWVGI